MRRILRWIWENVPMLLAFGIAFWTGFWLNDFEAMRWWIIMAAFFMVLRELHEIRARLTEADSKGRHSGNDREPG